MTLNRMPFRSTEAGVALAVALILLVVLTLLALSGVRLSTMELRMALNDELRVIAYQEAQSLVDVSVRQFSNTPVLSPGTVICARDCSDVRVTLPSATYGTPTTSGTDLGEDRVNVIIQGIPPLAAEPPVGTGFSLAVFDASYLQVTGQWNKNLQGLGAATVNEGIAIVYGSAGDTPTTTNQDEFGGS
jgi:hypothetical protein